MATSTPTPTPTKLLLGFLSYHAKCIFKKALSDVIHMADFRSKRHFGPKSSDYTMNKSLCTDNWNSSGKLFKSLKRLMKWYIYIFLNTLITLIFSCFCKGRLNEERLMIETKTYLFISGLLSRKCLLRHTIALVNNLFDKYVLLNNKVVILISAFTHRYRLLILVQNS